jgi:hypothetical protein
MTRVPPCRPCIRAHSPPRQNCPAGKIHVECRLRARTRRIPATATRSANRAATALSSERQQVRTRKRRTEIRCSVCPKRNRLAAPEYYFLRGGNPSGKSPLACQSYPKNAAPIPKFDIEGVRRDFPALHQLVNGKPLIWLDNAATTHKPQAVIDATSQFYSRDNSNIHRAAHALAARSTELFEAGAKRSANFSAQPTRRKLFSFAARPKPSISSRKVTAAKTSAQAMKSSSANWSITRTSCRGSCSRSKPARSSKSSRSMIAAN